jgi:uncharacterized protein (TIGR03118 family)
MHVSRRTTRTVALLAAAAAGVSLAVPNVASASEHARGKNKLAITQTNLVSDLDTVGAMLPNQADVKNPWGLALGPTTPLWSANMLTSTATLYSVDPVTAATALVPAVRVTFPDTPELPTGQVFNGGTGFVNTTVDPTTGVSHSAPARFIFSTIVGNIEAWAPPPVDPAQGNAETRAHVPGASYTGLAISSTNDMLYAADFAGGKVDVFDSTFAQVPLAPWQFHDKYLSAEFHPFGIQQLNGDIFVAYAVPGPGGPALSGRGLGVVDEFTADGKFVGRVASGHKLNAPWGMAVAPAGWGRIAGDLLVGNFGDGRINVIRANDDRDDHGKRGHKNDRGAMFGPQREGQLRVAHGKRFDVGRGLWALLPGTATTGGTDSVFFSAGINNEADGLIGLLRKA